MLEQCIDSSNFLPLVAEDRASYDGAPRSHRDLKVYRRAFDLSMRIFRLTDVFPAEERYSLTDQVRRSSRSVCANIGEAWRKRRYKAAFLSKLNDSETEAGETQVWIEFAAACGYVTDEQADTLLDEYEALLRTLLGIMANADKWVLRPLK